VRIKGLASLLAEKLPMSKWVPCNLASELPRSRDSVDLDAVRGCTLPGRPPPPLAGSDSRFLFLAELLETEVVTQWIPLRMEP
jgi:hypothetical protein